MEDTQMDVQTPIKFLCKYRLKAALSTGDYTYLNQRTYI